MTPATVMDPATPTLNPNPSTSPSPSPNVYQIGGVPVEFPYKPYGSQLAFMGRVISTFDRARRQGHCHALLESPTGTGKSLSLLCSSLAWQQHQSRRFPDRPPADPLPLTVPNPDYAIIHGGGFIPEPEPSRNPEQTPKATSNRAQKKSVAPTIYYASRTHSQISQVIREYKKTSYRVPMAVLASRKHYCTNKYVCTKENVDEECKLLLKDTGVGCPQFKNAHKVKGHPSLQKGGCHEAHDIEDLVKVGRSVKGCSYFAAQTMAAEAQLVFCPYSYLINPIVRRAMDIDIKGSIVILDEAHNIEDMAREAGSLDVEEEILYALQTELGQLCTVESVAVIYQPLYDVIQGIISWIGVRTNNLQKREFEQYSSYWTGDKAMRELQQAGITQQCFPILQECATKAIKAVSDAESDGVCLSGISAITLEGLFSSLGYFFSGNGCHALDYQLALKRYVKRDESNAASGWKCSLSLWCLNPAIVFKEIANLSLSVILTSGTLSPMGSFASELGVQFEACMEAPHVIDVDSQLWAAVISSGPGNCQLNASYKTADGYGFQDSLGASLEEICKIVPGGALVFFPSYKLLEKLRARWCHTGQWSRLNAEKPIFVEPRGTDDFEPVLKGYYDSILGNNKVAHRKPKHGLKRAHKHLSTDESSQNPVKRGAAFLAVCRGKVSEGIDFSDENARVVVIVGIPFPNTNDIQVVLKKKYNDTYKSSKGLLSGSEWYCHQAFRALNQAAGRCIRHRFDYGAIILLDERLKEERNLAYISKWLRKSIKQYDNFDESLEGLRTFFLDAEKRLSQKGKDALETELLISDTNKESLPPSKQNSLNQQIPQKRNQKQKVGVQNRRKVIPDNAIARSKGKLTKASSPVATDEDSPVGLKAQCNINSKATSETNQKCLNSCGEYIDLESRIQKQSRWSETISIESSIDSLDQSTFVKNTAIEDQDTCQIDNSKDVNSYSTVVQTCDELQDRPSFSLYGTIPNGNQSEGACNSTVSPERIVHVELYNPALESSLSKSVNSHRQTKRRPIDSQLSSFAQMGHFSTLDTGSCYHDCANGRSISVDNEERTESHFADNCSRCKRQEPMQRAFMKDNISISPLTADLSIEKKLHICCSFCKNSLGLRGNNFLVTCSLTSLSKVYLSYVLKYGPTTTCSPDHLSKGPRINTPIIISDVSSVDHSILNGSSREGAPRQDIWSEEDGCVFRMVSCPFCTESKCLGAQVLATDASNVHLLNKVLFYADHLDVRDEQTPKEETTLSVCANVGRGSGLVEIEKYAYNRQPKNPAVLTQTKSKLKLPKREQFPSQHQDGVHT